MVKARARILSGGCQCGAVRYALHAAPSAVGLCSCRMCQKAVGGPFAAFATVAMGDFAWTRGTPGSFTSSSIAAREFCAACGTPLAFRALDGSMISVTLGSLDDPGAVVPAEHDGVESEVRWLRNIGHLPRQTTEEDYGAEATAAVVNHQHPDHDTPHWPPRAALQGKERGR